MSLPPPDQIRETAEHSRWFTQEVQAHEAILRNYLRGHFPFADTDDLVQESYLRVWKARLGRVIRSPKSFLFRVAWHLGIDQARHKSRSPIISCPDLGRLSVIEDGPGVAEIASTREEIVLLGRAIQALPAQCRSVILLRVMKDFSHQEIAQELGLTEPAVRKHIARGVKRLEKSLRRRR